MEDAIALAKALSEVKQHDRRGAGGVRGGAPADRRQAGGGRRRERQLVRSLPRAHETRAARVRVELYSEQRPHRPGAAEEDFPEIRRRIGQLMLFPTTLVGSYPQPEWLIDRKKLAGRFPPRVRARELWRVEESFLKEAQDDATVLAIRAQEAAGLDIITDGEIRRESYSNRFATALEGVDIDNPGSALDRSGHPNPVPRIVGKIRRKHAVEVQDLLFLRKTYEKAGEDHRSRPLHHVAAGAERLLQVGGRGGDGLRRGGERGDQGPVRRRRRHRADRRALHAGAAGEGAAVRPEGAEPRPGGRAGRNRGAHLLRLRRDHPRAARGLFLPARVRRLLVQAGVDRDRAVEARLFGSGEAYQTRRSWSAASTSPT